MRNNGGFALSSIQFWINPFLTIVISSFHCRDKNSPISATGYLVFGAVKNSYSQIFRRTLSLYCLAVLSLERLSFSPVAVHYKE